MVYDELNSDALSLNLSLNRDEMKWIKAMLLMAMHHVTYALDTSITSDKDA